MVALLSTTDHLEVSTFGGPGHRVGKAEDAGIQLPADDRLDQVGTGTELDQLDVKAMLLIQTGLVCNHGLGIVHHTDVANLELLLRLSKRAQQQQSWNQPMLCFHFDLDSDSQHI